MGKNRQEPADTGTTDNSQTDGTEAADFTRQQQQPPTTGRQEAPVGDDAISDPNIINR